MAAFEFTKKKKKISTEKKIHLFCIGMNTYAYDWFFALIARFRVFFDVAFRADRVSFTFVECNGCNRFLAHGTHKMFWMP